VTVGLGDVVGVQRVLNPARKVTCECSVDEKSTEDRRGRLMSPKTMNVIMARLGSVGSVEKSTSTVACPIALYWAR